MATTFDEEDFVLRSVQGNIVQLAMDSNGTHVVQAIIKTLREERIGFIVSEVVSNEKLIMDVACNCHGICVIKALIEKTKS